MLSSCLSTTVSEVNIVEVKNELTSVEDVDIFLERESYSYNELDEMFYIIENNTTLTITTNEFYLIDYYSEDEWASQDIDQFWNFNKFIEILSGEATEIPFWLSVNSFDFEPGFYRFRTRVTYPEVNYTEDIYMYFEINH